MSNVMPCVDDSVVYRQTEIVPHAVAPDEIGAQRYRVYTRVLVSSRLSVAVEAVIFLDSARIRHQSQFGAPDTIRTCDLCLRRATLYPAELRVRRAFI